MKDFVRIERIFFQSFAILTKNEKNCEKVRGAYP